MKSSLLAVAVLMSVVAHAQNAPPLTPIQLIPAAAVVKPTAPVAKPAASKPAAAKPAPVVNSHSDEEALRQLRQAEAEFKAKKSVSVPLSGPVTVSPIVVVAKPVQPSTSNNQQLPSIQRPRAVVRVAPRPRAMIGADAAAIVRSQCAASKNPLRCMNIQLNDAELRVDSAEVRLLNCREIRKFDTSFDRNIVDALVTGRMYQLRFKETQAFNAELASAGRISKLKSREMELRATIAHLKAVSALNEKVCSAEEFAKLYDEAKTLN